MFSCSDKTSKTKRLTDDLTAGLVASHSLSGNMSRHRLCSQSTSLPSSRPSSNILKKLPIWIPAVFSFNSWPLKQNCLSTSQDRPVAVGIYGESTSFCFRGCESILYKRGPMPIWITVLSTLNGGHSANLNQISPVVLLLGAQCVFNQSLNTGCDFYVLLWHNMNQFLLAPSGALVIVMGYYLHTRGHFKFFRFFEF